MANKHLSRRDFLLRFGAIGALGAGAGTLVSACGGGDTASTPAPEAAAAAPEAAAPEAACTDLSGLTDEEVTMRQVNLEYMDVTNDPARACSLCALYIPPAEGATCATCTLVKGPIAPNGSCKSFAPKPTA